MHFSTNLNLDNKIMQLSVTPWIIINFIYFTEVKTHWDNGTLYYHKNPLSDGHRCGVCPTYFQKICGFDFQTNSTFIFDNHCIMDLYNCIDGTDFVPLNYDHCVYFGNFAYVHGEKYEDQDYGEDHLILKNSKKNPDFVSWRR